MENEGNDAINLPTPEISDSLLIRELKTRQVNGTIDNRLKETILDILLPEITTTQEIFYGNPYASLFNYGTVLFGIFLAGSLIVGVLGLWSAIYSISLSLGLAIIFGGFLQSKLRIRKGDYELETEKSIS